MRRAFVEIASQLLSQDERVALLLGDIGVYGFRNELKRYPSRVYNIGILEQTTVGVGAGLSMTGFIPIIHTIAPFLAERALEQIKVDFAYQELRGNIVTVGGSYDYAALGATHHCPGDVGILLNVPNVDIYVPGTPDEFMELLEANYANDSLSYFRLSETPNSQSFAASDGSATLLSEGRSALVIAVGPVLDTVLAAVEGLDVSVAYVTSIRPFPDITLPPAGIPTIIVEPFYQGTTATALLESKGGLPIMLTSIGVPRTFLRNYGTKFQHDTYLRLDPISVRERVKAVL